MARIETGKVKLYRSILERIFFSHYSEGDTEVHWERPEIPATAAALGLPNPGNFGDLPYRYRYRAAMPEAIAAKAPEGKVWILRSRGTSKYKFVAVIPQPIVPNQQLTAIKIPDSTPGVVVRYSKGDEQALLARLRYNRLLDIFTGLTCNSLQNHLRTTVKEIGQVETDEIYIGVDRRGIHYVLPVQAKGRKDRQSIVQIEQDLAVCAEKFPNLVPMAIAAQFKPDGVIALFAFKETREGVKPVAEAHYQLVPNADLTDGEVASYRRRRRQQAKENGEA